MNLWVPAWGNDLEQGGQRSSDSGLGEKPLGILVRKGYDE